MFVPLYSRPVIIEMLKEHALKGLQRLDAEITQDDFIDNLKYIVQNQLKMVLNTRNTPSVMRNGILLDRDIPLLGYLSTYTLNLTILASVLCPQGFEFDENEYKNTETSELDSKPWDKLASLWKTWFSTVDLAGLSVILKANRKNESSVIVLCNDKFEATRYEEPVDILLCVSSTIADNLFSGLTGLHTQHFCEITRMDEKTIKNMLQNENIDLYFSYLIMLLRKEVNGFSNELKEENYNIRHNYYKINGVIKEIVSDERIVQINSDTMLCLFELLENCINRKILFINTRKTLIKILPRLMGDSKINLKKEPSNEFICGIRLMQLLIKDVGLLLYDRNIIRNEMFNRDIFIGENWNEDIEDIERIMYTISKYRKNGRLYAKDYENIDDYQLLLLDAVESSFMTNDKSKSMSKMIKPNNIELLIELSPELLSQTILLCVKNSDIHRINNRNILTHFFDCCLKQLSNIGIMYFGFNAIINSIKIAKITHDDKFLGYISEILFRQLFGRHPKEFSSIIYLYPDFVANLIEIMPDLFSYKYMNMFEEIVFFDKQIRYISPKKLLDYIRIIRFFYRRNDIEKVDERLRENLHRLMKMTSKYDNYLGIDISNLTMHQLSDVLWFAKHTDNRRLFDEIQGMLTYFGDFDFNQTENYYHHMFDND